MTANQGVTSHAALMRYEPAPADIPLELALAATYTREVRAGIERIWENVLDWEHLRASPDPHQAGLEFARSAFRHACAVCEWDPALAASAEGRPPPVA